LVVGAIDDAKFYESISKATNPIESEELERYYYTELVPKRKFFDKLADSDELAKAVLRLGRLVMQHGKPFTTLRKPAKELVTVVSAAYKAANEVLEAGKALAGRQKKKAQDKKPATEKPGAGWGSASKKHVGLDFSVRNRPSDPHRSRCPSCNHSQVNFEIDDEQYE
jgi:hypothetical protein